MQLRAIALRVQGMDVTKIAAEVDRDRTTVSRWFSNDSLVIEELARRVEDRYQTELQQHVNLRAKAMGVVESALDGGDVRAALAILRLGPRQGTRQLADEGSAASNTGSFDTMHGAFGRQDIEQLLHDLEVTSPWQIHVQRVAGVLRAPAPVSDAEGILDRLLLLDDVANTVVRALEEMNGEGLAGYSSVREYERDGLTSGARRTIEEAWAIIGGDDDGDDAGEPRWPGEEEAGRAIKLIGQALVTMLACLEGAPEALGAGAGTMGARLAARLIAARDAARVVVDGDRHPTVPSLADAASTLTAGFGDLVTALDEAAVIVVDAEWAEAADDGEGPIS
ncbi:MAG: hypothetical protein WD096_08190 [Actinomycetota bacterium]